MSDDLFRYVLRLADDHLVLGQRLGEWCGQAPSLEEDLAIANIGLDCLGQARALYTCAGKVEGKGRDEDDLAFLRPEREYCNALLVEQPNRDFAWAIARQFYFSAFMLPFWRDMAKSTDDDLRAIAAKAEKEVAYHLRHSAEWVIRLGDGTEESRARAQAALEKLWGYTRELFDGDAIDEMMMQAGIGIDPGDFHENWRDAITAVLGEATLTVPEASWSIGGGKKGVHSEHLGFLLAEMQFLPRAYPDAKW